MTLSKRENIVSWVFQVVAAVILLQSLFFKFTGASESVYIFSTLGVEPWGRIATGLAELAAGVLLLIPRTASVGAVLSMGIVSGAILSHLTLLGVAIEEIGDGGELFMLALVVLVSSVIVAFIRRRELPLIGQRFQ